MYFLWFLSPKNVSGLHVFNDLFLHCFFSDEHRNMTGLTADELDVLSNITEIQGYLNIQAYHPNLTSLSFLRNLKKVFGRQLDPM